MTPGSMLPLRVPMGTPLSAEKPIEVSMLRPSRPHTDWSRCLDGR